MLVSNTTTPEYFYRFITSGFTFLIVYLLILTPIKNAGVECTKTVNSSDCLFAISILGPLFDLLGAVGAILIIVALIRKYKPLIFRIQ